MRRAWLLVLAACAGRQDRSAAQMSFDGAGGASDDRSAFAYIDDADHLVVITAEGTRTRARPSCMVRPQRLFVAPRGLAVGAFGAHGMPGDLWGHAGKQVTANCVLNLTTGESTPLPGPGALLWFGAHVIMVPAEQLPGAGVCATASSTTGPVAVCAGDTTLAVRRYRDETLAHDADVTWPLPANLSAPKLRISPDGRRVALWDARTLVVTDLATGAALFTYGDLGRLETVELDPGGADRIMLVGMAYELGESPDHRVRIVGFDGVVHEERREPGADRTVYWTDAKSYWSTTTSRVDRRVLGAR